jgi:hypothetical protein
MVCCVCCICLRFFILCPSYILHVFHYFFF